MFHFWMSQLKFLSLLYLIWWHKSILLYLAYTLSPENIVLRCFLLCGFQRFFWFIEISLLSEIWKVLLKYYRKYNYYSTLLQNPSLYLFLAYALPVMTEMYTSLRFLSFGKWQLLICTSEQKVAILYCLLFLTESQ